MLIRDQNCLITVFLYVLVLELFASDNLNMLSACEVYIENQDLDDFVDTIYLIELEDYQ